ncbi:MAG: hypothetical protein PHQ05_13800 [Sterolibacterium sp.]|nr:hypothetical protein [Sterolibacterium sp.]
MKILVRGDCCSMRFLKKNRHYFDSDYSVVINEKAPNAVFVDSLNGINPDRSMLRRYVDENRIDESKRYYFQCQFERSVLDLDGVDLVVMDNYSEMNFQLWRSRALGWRVWVPQEAILNKDMFEADFISDGYRTLEQSANDAIRFIEHIRNRNPNVPVLYLNQPLEYYPKLVDRKHFYALGLLIKDRIENIYAGKILDLCELEPEDLGTGGGPDKTLHFTAGTYIKMVEPCLDEGLSLILKPKLNAEAMSTENLSSVPDSMNMENGAISGSESVNSAKVLDTENRCTIQNSSNLFPIFLGQDDPDCQPECVQIVDKLIVGLQEYFEFDESVLVRTKRRRYECALISLDRYPTYGDYESVVKKSGKGNRIRLLKKAIAAGYYCEQFAWKNHIPDIHEINTSKPIRSGGEMKSSYMRTVDELGGAPNKITKIIDPKCKKHWSIPFGVFKNVSGYRQGEIEVNKKLYGYILLHRRGELAIYSLIIGHGDYLSDGIVNLLHHHVMQWILHPDNKLTAGIKAVMYGGIDQGNDGLRDWKRREGFQGYVVKASKSAACNVVFAKNVSPSIDNGLTANNLHADTGDGLVINTSVHGKSSFNKKSFLDALNLYGDGVSRRDEVESELPLLHYESIIKSLASDSRVEFITYDDLDWGDDYNYTESYPVEFARWRDSLKNGQRDPEKIYLLLQHDCDSGPLSTMQMAALEASYSAKSSIMLFNKWKGFKGVGEPEIYPNDWESIRKLKALGFVFGYHCNSLENCNYAIGKVFEEFDADVRELSEKLGEISFFSPHGCRADSFGNVNASFEYPLHSEHKIRWVHNKHSVKFNGYYSDGGLATRLAKGGDKLLDLESWIDKLVPGRRYRALIHAQYYSNEYHKPVSGATDDWYLSICKRYSS